ncbi:uncharacterized protein YktA (UPF0223 family) [Paenibacillus sp. PvR133]|uniref:hypothetical protein n=1 Tax=Paenibacillus sp. PvR133 TaxID=2806598 RepID=UPI001AE1CACA|nr:hypothetical protein [Paenibacillus sp. PvR133]MBP1177509.1 uncharacterized protein YktA (UPF0223 family) [Paenibacillus sp. PvR133]
MNIGREEGIEKSKINMLEKLYYLQLVASLTPKSSGGIMNKSVREKIFEIANFIKESSALEFHAREVQLYEYLVQIYNTYKTVIKPKINHRKIGRDFNELFAEENRNPYSYGIEYGWIKERIEIVNDPWPSDLPYQSKIGIGAHFPSVGIEEEFMLRDAFYLLVKAYEVHEDMHAIAKKYKDNGKDVETKEDYLILSSYNHTVATYSRLGTQSFYFFTEAFINSIGFDYYLRNKDKLESNEIEVLQGKHKGRFIPLEQRIQKFQSIIRSDNRIVVITTDENQIKEPFKTFFNEIKEIRDAASHFTPLKGEIWRKPDEWLNKVSSAAKICMEVSKQCWLACYPDRDLPEYLVGLDYDEHIETARKRSQDIKMHL